MNLGVENEIIEFKKSTSELKEASISVAAILNKHRGGTLYFGVKNNGDLIGMTIGADTTRDISHRIQEAVKPTPLISVEQLSHNGLDYVKVTFNGKDVPYSAFGRYYIRTSDEDRELTPSQLRDLFFDTGDYTDWENEQTNCTISDIDEGLLRSSYEDGLKAGRYADPFTDSESILSAMNLLVNDRLTNAGVLLFSKKKPLTLKLALFATDERITLIDHAHFRGNIYECIEEGMIFLKKHMRWRAEYSDNVKRTDVPEVPVRALREIVINSFAHAKFAGMLSTHEIDIYPSSIEIFNPGRLPISVVPEKFAEGREKSLLKNKTIADVLFRTTVIEAFATGFKKVINLCREADVEYRYHNSDEGFSFEFLRKQINGIREKTTADLVLELIRNNNRVSINEMVKISGKGRSTIIRALDALKADGIIIHEGDNRTGKWVVLK